MSTKLKHQSPSGNVTAMPSRCVCDGCNKKADLMEMCGEHYDWFKFGLVTKEGKRPTDFDKKYTAYVKMQKRQAA